MSAVVMSHKRPTFNPAIPLQVVELSTRCWAEDPAARPTFSGFLDSLGNIENLMKQGLLHRRMQRRSSVTAADGPVVEKSSLSSVTLRRPRLTAMGAGDSASDEQNLIEPEE